MVEASCPSVMIPTPGTLYEDCTIAGADVESCTVESTETAGARPCTGDKVGLETVVLAASAIPPVARTLIIDSDAVSDVFIALTVRVDYPRRIQEKSKIWPIIT